MGTRVGLAPPRADAGEHRCSAPRHRHSDGVTANFLLPSNRRVSAWAKRNIVHLACPFPRSAWVNVGFYPAINDGIGHPNSADVHCICDCGLDVDIYRDVFVAVGVFASWAPTVGVPSAPCDSEFHCFVTFVVCLRRLTVKRRSDRGGGDAI